jgi:hypothetical protein
VQPSHDYREKKLGFLQNLFVKDALAPTGCQPN